MLHEPLYSFLFLWLMQCFPTPVFPEGFCSAYLPVPMALSGFLLFYWLLLHCRIKWTTPCTSQAVSWLAAILPSIQLCSLCWPAFTTHFLDFSDMYLHIPSSRFLSRVSKIRFCYPSKETAGMLALLIMLFSSFFLHFCTDSPYQFPFSFPPVPSFRLEI